MFGGLVSIDIGVEARSKRTLKVLIKFLLASKTLLIMLMMTKTKVHLQLKYSLNLFIAAIYGC